MNLKTVSNDPEVKSALPPCIAATNGFPVACWKYYFWLEICDKKATILEAHTSSELQCDCGIVPARCKDESWHVCTTDLEIVTDTLAGNRMKKGTTFRDSYQKFHVDRTEGDVCAGAVTGSLHQD